MVNKLWHVVNSLQNCSQELATTAPFWLRMASDWVFCATLYMQINNLFRIQIFSFTALTLLVGHQEEYPACKKMNDKMLAWLSAWSKMHVICIWSSWWHCHPIISCFIKIQNGFYYMRSPVRLSSVCRLSVVCLSVVCNVRAPYLGGSNFCQYFYGIRYLGHSLTSTKNFTDIIPREPFRRGI